MINILYNGRSYGAGAGMLAFPDLFCKAAPIESTGKSMVLIDDGGSASLVDCTAMLPAKANEDGEMPAPAYESFFSTNATLPDYRSGPRAVFSKGFTDCWVVSSSTHREMGRMGARGMIEMSYFPSLKASDDEEEQKSEYLTISRKSFSTFYYGHVGVYSLYLGTVWPYYADSPQGYQVKVRLPSTSLVNNSDVFGDRIAYAQGVLFKQYEFKAAKLANAPSSYDMKPTYSGSFEDTATEIDEEGNTKKKTHPYYTAAGSLSAYDYKVFSRKATVDSNVNDCFDPGYAYGHDRAYTIGFPINMHTDPQFLFDDVLQIGTHTGIHDTRHVFTSEHGTPFYRQFMRVYPVVAMQSDRIIEYDPVGYKAEYNLMPVSSYALFPKLDIEYVGPSIRIEFDAKNSDKSTLLDCPMYDNTDFAIRMCRTGYTNMWMEYDMFVVQAHERGSLVMRILPKGGDINQIDGRHLNASEQDVIAYANNNVHAEEYFYIDAFTFVKHKFHYSSYTSAPLAAISGQKRYIDGGFVVPSSESDICTVLVGAVDVNITQDNLVSQSYHYEESEENPDKAHWQLDESNDFGAQRVHAGHNLNLFTKKWISRQIGKSYTFQTPSDIDDRDACVSIGSYHDTLLCRAEESGLGFTMCNSSHILMGINSQRGVLDKIFNKFAGLNEPYVCAREDADEVKSFDYTYYSVVLLLDNNSVPKSSRCFFWGESHSELFWMGSAMHRKYRYTQMPTHTHYVTENDSDNTVEFDYRGTTYGLGIEFAMWTNTGRLTLLKNYGQYKHSHSWKFVFLETTVTAEFDVTFEGIKNSSSVTNASAEVLKFPLGACTCTPTIYKVKAQKQGSNQPIQYNVPVVLKGLNIKTKSVRNIGDLDTDGCAVFTKVHYYKGHVFSYTKDTVFAFDPKEGFTGIKDKKAQTRFVQSGHSHRYIDRFDYFIENGFGDYVLSQDPQYNPSDYEG